MQYQKLTSDKYIFRFDAGDQFGDLFREFLAKEEVVSGFFTGIGSTQKVTLGFYDTARETYDWTTFEGLYEITNLTGNVARLDGKPVFHIHITLSGHDFKAIGGHLKDMVVGATCEIMLTTTNTLVERGPSSQKELFTLVM